MRPPTVVLADFAPSTGDPVFDDVLRQGLSSQLEQSPFLNLPFDECIAQTLSLMVQPEDSRLTHNLAREVCQCTASAAVRSCKASDIGPRSGLAHNPCCNYVCIMSNPEVIGRPWDAP
jgi:hypothetical protein